MANREHFAILKQGVGAWNTWREENPDVRPDLSGANLNNAYLGGADLRRTELSGANLFGADLNVADLRGVDLHKADLREAKFSGANLYSAKLYGADLRRAKGLTHKQIDFADTDEKTKQPDFLKK